MDHTSMGIDDRLDPFANCATCHGDDLQGGFGPSCFTCHDQMWPDPNQAPFADAGPAVTGNVGQPVQFDGSGSIDPDGTIALYEWDFGDGNTGTGEQPTHTYTSDAGSPYTVTLTVTDDGGLTDTATTTAEIAVPTNSPPVVDIGGPYEALVGEQVNFDLSGTTDPDGDNLIFMWLDWGDGTPVVGPTPPFPPVGPTASHTYNAAGDYIARATVADGTYVVEIEIPVKINDAPPPPQSNTWAVRLPFLGAHFTVEFEEFAGILLVRTTDADANKSIGIGMEFDGIIFWMDFTGAIYFGNLDRQAGGSGAGIVFGYAGASSVWIATQM